MAVSISLSITQNSQNITNNTSSVTVKLTASWTQGSYNGVVDASGTPQAKGWVKIDGVTYNFASAFNYPPTNSGSRTIYTKTLNTTHNSDGTKVLSCSASYSTGTASGTVTTGTVSKVLTTIPRKSSLSASDGTLGRAQTLTVTKQASSFTHTITYECGSVSGTVCTKSSSTSISWTPPESLASQNTTDESVSVTFTITTYSGSTDIGSNTKTITCTIPATIKPSCSITVTDVTVPANTYGGSIKGISRLKVTINTISAYGSPISSYRTTVNGVTYYEPSFTTDVLKTSGTFVISSTVTDKRGHSGSTKTSITVLDYTPPTITRLSAVRCNSDGSENKQGKCIKISITSDVVSLSNKNTPSYSLEYKKSSVASYTPIAISNVNVYSLNVDDIVVAADTGSSYDIRLTATDNFNTTTKTAVAPTGFTLMHWMKNGLGMAIGKISELSNVLDIGLQTRFSGGLMYSTLEPKTDLNDKMTPNFYAGLDIKTNEYVNCPLTDGSFTLIVYAAGGNGQARQYIEECDKAIPEKYERYLYPSSGWGDWIKLSPTNLAQTMTHVPAAVNAYELVGSIVIPAYKYFTITARGIFNNASCKGVVIGENDSNYKHSYAAAINSDTPVHFPSCTYSGYTGANSKTFYIWGCWAGTNTNSVQISGYYIPH